MQILRKLVDFTLYSSLWIGLCAGAQVFYTYQLLNLDPSALRYSLFVALSTITLYSIHRLVGIRRVKQFRNIGRFGIIETYMWHIVAYGLIASVAAFILLIILPRNYLPLLVVPMTISLAYVLPILPGKKRLRDVPVVKIFLIALVWGSLSTLVPIAASGITDSSILAMTFAERALFIFAITLPFDIRDNTIDKISGVKTIVHLVGLKNTRSLAIGLLVLSAILNAVLIWMGTYPQILIAPYAVFVLVTAGLVWYANERSPDYYYSGLLDGTMILLPMLYYAAGWVLA